MALTGPKELDTPDDKALITRIQNGDTEAFNAIVHKYQQRIYNLVYKRVRHHETAEDLCQEVFLKAWRALPNFQGRSVFYSWLSRIAINCSIDFLRRQKREIVFTCEALPENADDELPMTWTQASPDEILEKEELRHIIRKEVRQLPLGQRRTFYLRYREGLMIKEIAARLNKKEGTVKASLYHAHQKLQKVLRPYLQNEPIE